MEDFGCRILGYQSYQARVAASYNMKRMHRGCFHPWLIWKELIGEKDLESSERLAVREHVRDMISKLCK
ncbi:hypothetical protein P168DRAFT_286456 [Aspergillus campestris IBT 28561]|uniref:Uncharacterized protein n=1 Tax=Aspergillus campestris (strain IBT 28561) TaxID=1392248 RepID=A0A2I1DEP5_ASPC2|nr:uncharacterized protein P168DRAFT_286456 [Aspergillus campestris IBT 28561]PKY08320.1 hypothetical protein P168DRAFT_286456 [Aspergillus campestris IBT 28561]